MRRLITLAAVGAAVIATGNLFAQVVDPTVVGPARRAAAAAGDAAGAPGVERRIENREQRRDVIRAEEGNPNAAARATARANDPNQWRFKYHNNRWWYYTPQNQWMYYSNNNWSNYDPNANVAPRYTTGYRGDGGTYYNGRRRFRNSYYQPTPVPYSNGTPAGNAGSNIGADIGAAANGAAGAQTGAAIGGAIGNGIGAATGAPPVAPPSQVPTNVPNPSR